MNKSTANVPFRNDSDMDITAIRIGKARVARRKESKLSELKQAIISHRESRAPTVTNDLTIFQDNSTIADSTVGVDVTPLVTQEESSNLDTMCYKILKELARLQARGSDQPPEKRYKYKRFVAGIREVHRSLSRDELKCIIIARNVESGVDMLDNIILELQQTCDDKQIPFFFALNKRRLGKALGRSMKQSVIGVTSLEGVHQEWKALLEELEVLRRSGTVTSTVRIHECV